MSLRVVKVNAVHHFDAVHDWYWLFLNESSICDVDFSLDRTTDDLNLMTAEYFDDPA